MKCPQCSFAISSNRDACPRCQLDLTEFKKRLGVKSSRVSATNTSLGQSSAGLPNAAGSQSTEAGSLSTTSNDRQRQFQAAINELQTIDRSEQTANRSAYRDATPKDDISDLLEALGELRESSDSYDPNALSELFDGDSPPPKLPDTNWHNDDSILNTSTRGGSSSPITQIEASLFGSVQEAKDATENLLDGFEDVLESGEQDDAEVGPQAAPLAKATTTGSFPAQGISPEVMDFSDSDEQFEERLDAMIGDLVFDVEAVRVERKDPPHRSENSMMFEDMEIEIEFEDDDEEEEEEEIVDSPPFDEPAESMEATQAFSAQSGISTSANVSSGDSYDDLLASFAAKSSSTQEHSIAPEHQISDSSGKSPTVHEPMSTAGGHTTRPVTQPATHREKALPDSVRATLRAARTQDDPSVKRLAALLAEAYGVNIDQFEELETIDSLEAELNNELGALLSEGTSFYSYADERKAQLEASSPELAGMDPELLSLESELLEELDALRQAGMTFSGADSPQSDASGQSVTQAESVTQAPAASMPESTPTPTPEPTEELSEELQMLSDELDHELEELLGTDDLTALVGSTELAGEVAEELDLLASRDVTADEIAALTSELSDELAALESETFEKEIDAPQQEAADNPLSPEFEDLASEAFSASDSPQFESPGDAEEFDRTATDEVDAIFESDFDSSLENLPVARVVTLDSLEKSEENDDKDSDALATVQTGQFLVADLERMADENEPINTLEESSEECFTVEDSTEDDSSDPAAEIKSVLLTGQFFISDLNRLDEQDSTSESVADAKLDSTGIDTTEQPATSGAAPVHVIDEELDAFMNEVSFANESEDDAKEPAMQVALTGQFFAADLDQLDEELSDSDSTVTTPEDFPKESTLAAESLASAPQTSENSEIEVLDADYEQAPPEGSLEEEPVVVAASDPEVEATAPDAEAEDVEGTHRENAVITPELSTLMDAQTESAQITESEAIENSSDAEAINTPEESEAEALDSLETTSNEPKPLVDSVQTGTFFALDLQQLEAGLAELEQASPRNIEAPSEPEAAQSALGELDSEAVVGPEEFESELPSVDTLEQQTEAGEQGEDDFDIDGEVDTEEELDAEIEVEIEEEDDDEIELGNKDSDYSSDHPVQGSAADPTNEQNVSMEGVQTGEFLALDLNRIVNASPTESKIAQIPSELWAHVEQEVNTALASDDAVIELSFGELTEFKHNDRISVLFEAVDEEILDPTKRKRHEIEVLRSEPRKVDNTSLNSAFSRFEKEAVEVAVKKKEKLERGIDYFYSEISQQRASGLRRFFAGVVDVIFLLALGAGISLLLFAPIEFYTEAITVDPRQNPLLLLFGFKVLLTSFLAWLLLTSVTTASFGKTLGCKLMKLAIVTKEGDPVDLNRALLRTMATAFCITTVGLSFLLPVLLRKRPFHDFVAHTEVVDDE